MNYLQKPASLEEKALIRVAIDACQANDFKETVLCLEKPVYGAFIPHNKGSFFVSDPEKLAQWEEKKNKSGLEYYNFVSACYPSDEKRLEQWEPLLEEQCWKLAEGLPVTLRHKVQGWMNRMALEYLSYCRRQEALFGLSRYFLMEFVTREDWNESGRLDEEKLAERLVKDERLTVLQRYRMACVYCLRVDSRDCVLATLWERLTPEEKTLLSGEDDPNLSAERNRLVLLWSYYMDRGRDEKVTGRKKYLWRYAIEQAVADGNRVALMPCWRWLSETARQSIVMKMACDAFYSWLSTQPNRDLYTHLNEEWRKNLVSLQSSSDEFSNVRQFNLPFYYSDLLCFFLSEMSEADQLTFFKKAFQDKRAHYILECFLDWPHQDYFLPTVRKLWGILPQYNYGRCLLLLASKYSRDYDWQTPRTVLYTKEDRHYDYQSLLFQLWEETPEDYKRYLFADKRTSVNHNGYRFIKQSQVLLNRFSRLYPPTDYRDQVINEGRVLLPRLLEKYPFTEKEEELFKRFLNYVPKEERIALMHSKSGEDICSTLTQREKWSFLDWILKECLPDHEIAGFKKQFIQSRWGFKLSFSKLQKQKETWLKNLIDWSFESNEERKEFKKKLIYSDQCLDACELLLREESFSEVEQMMDFCLDSEEMKEKFKAYLAECSSISLLENLACEKLDKIVAWCFDAEEQIVKFKKERVFCERIVEIHYDFIFQQQWEKVKRFYEWFDLSTEEIKKIKKDTVFSEQSIRDVKELLYGSVNIIPYLNWCLLDEEMVLNFKNKLEDYFPENCDEEDNQAKERLDHLIEELLSGLRKDVQSESEEQVHSIQTRGEKRVHEVTEEESHSSSKRMAK